MSRTIHRIPVTTDQMLLNRWINDFMTKKSYKLKMKKGQYFWKKGGFWTAARYIQIGFGQGFVQTEAYIKYFGEIAIDNGGFVGAVPKQMLLSDLKEIENFIYMNGNLQNVPQPQQGQSIQGNGM